MPSGAGSSPSADRSALLSLRLNRLHRPAGRVLPTVPAGFLTFAQTTIYEAYDTPLRLWGVSVANDQQMAGLIMKIGGGLYLWTIIAGVFFRWSARERAAGRTARVAAAEPAASAVPQPVPAAPQTLTYSQVVEAFERAGEPPAEHPE